MSDSDVRHEGRIKTSDITVGCFFFHQVDCGWLWSSNNSCIWHCMGESMWKILLSADCIYGFCSIDCVFLFWNPKRMFVYVRGKFGLRNLYNEKTNQPRCLKSAFRKNCFRCPSICVCPISIDPLSFSFLFNYNNLKAKLIYSPGRWDLAH